MSETDSIRKPKDPIVNHLLKMTFGFYFMVALMVTLIQIIAEYNTTKNEVLEEVKRLEITFGPGLGTLLWTFNEENLLILMQGMSQVASIVGLKVSNINHEQPYAIGTVLGDDNHPVVYNFDGKATAASVSGNLFWHEFPIIYVDEYGEAHEAGKGILYSSDDIVFQRVKFGFILIAINSIVKTLALWLIFVFVIKRFLAKPLGQLTEAIVNIRLDHPKETAIAPFSKRNDELNTFRETFNDMIRKNVKLHEEVRASEEKYRTLVNNLNVGIYRNMPGIDGGFLHVNPAIVKMFGYSSTDEFMQTLVTDHYVHPEERQILLKTLEDQGKCQEYEIQATKKNGDPILVSISAQAQFDEAGQIKWIDGMIEDVTERKKSRDLLKNYNQQLEQDIETKTIELNQALEQLTGKHQQLTSFYHFISHELRTPVTAMLPYVRFLRKGMDCKPLEGNQIDYLNMLDDNLQRMKKLVDQLLDLAHIESLAQEPSLQEVSVAPLIQRRAQQLKGLFRPEVELQLQLLDPEPSILCVWDDLETVLENLLSNAAKYTEMGSVTVSTRLEHQGLTIAVEDTGTGMEVNQLNLIFERFSRLENKSMATGTGLGLNITKALVERMKGKITVKSTKNKGSLFEVWFPLANGGV